jgi:hypothetical protein
MGRAVEVVETAGQFEVVKGSDVGLHDHEQILHGRSYTGIAEFLVCKCRCRK